MRKFLSFIILLLLILGIIGYFLPSNFTVGKTVTITGVGSNGFTTGFIDGRQGSDPASTFDIQIPANQDKVKIDGWELAWQHVFGDSGFGLIANYTFVDSDAGYDNASQQTYSCHRGSQ